MSKKSNTSSLQKDRTKVLAVALPLIAEMGWQNFALDMAYSAAKLSVKKAATCFANKEDLLAFFSQEITKEMMEECGPFVDEPEKDRLFDVIMTRFDVLQKHRPVIIELFEFFKRNPLQGLSFLVSLRSTVQWILCAAQVTDSSYPFHLKEKAVLSVYMLTLRTWVRDDSPDLEKTMADLDKNLDRMIRFGGTFQKTSF